MATIYQLPIPIPATVGILPNFKFMVVGDNLTAVTTAGYLNQVNLESNPVLTTDILQILYSYNPQTQVGTWEQFTVAISNGTITLSQASFAGEVSLPTIVNHLIVSTNTGGGLANLTGTAINAGSLQAGLSGTAGTLISYSATASKGSLIVAAVANTGNTNTTISNVAMGQASVISIPDPGATTAKFLLDTGISTSNNVQITSGYQLYSVGTETASTTHTQVGATPLTAQVNNVTVANAGDTIILPAAVVGMVISAINNGATAGAVYGHGSDTINGTAGSSGSVTFAASKTTNFYCVASGTWLTGNVA